MSVSLAEIVLTLLPLSIVPVGVYGGVTSEAECNELVWVVAILSSPRFKSEPSMMWAIEFVSSAEYAEPVVPIIHFLDYFVRHSPYGVPIVVNGF